MRKSLYRGQQTTRLVAGPITVVLFALLLSHASGAAPQLGDLTIPAARVPDWFMPPDPADTSGWAVVNVHAANCSGTSSANDRTAIQAAIDAAGPYTIIQLDGSPGAPCIYNLRSGNVTINKGTLVLRGGGMAATNIRLNSPGQNVSIRGSTAIGAEANWTAGFTRGTTTITVASTTGIVAGDWIYLQAAFPAELGVGNACDPGLIGARNMAIVKVTSVNSGARTITFDRPLRNDFSNGVSCQQTIAEMHPISRSGIESLTLTVINPGADGWMWNSPTEVNNVVESWIKDVRYEGGIGPENDNGLNRFIVVSNAARVLFEQLWLSKIYFWKYNEAGIDFNPKSYECAVVNSIMEGLHVDTRIQSGASGIIWAYNFSRCEPATNCQERSTFLHGLANETLIESNDSEVSHQHDNHWGPQQYRNTLYRNRYTANSAHRKASYNKDSNIVGISSFCERAYHPLAPLMNVMLNVASRFRNDGNGVFDCATTAPANQYWIERNLVEGQLLLRPEADTRNISNVPTSLTTQGVGDWPTKRFPASLVFTSMPSWWLSAPWPATGADVDIIGSNMNKLPAQCRYEGAATGDCAPRAESLGVPGRPVLAP